MLVGYTARTTLAIPNVQLVPTVGIDDGELAGRGVRRAHLTTMPKVEHVPKGVKRSSVKKAVLPALGIVSIKREVRNQTYLKSV